MTTPPRAIRAGRAYLDLRKKARLDRRPVDEARSGQLVCRVLWAASLA